MGFNGKRRSLSNSSRLGVKGSWREPSVDVVGSNGGLWANGQKTGSGKPVRLTVPRARVSVMDPIRRLP